MAMYQPNNIINNINNKNAKNGVKYHCGEKIFTISNTISQKECQSLIDRAENQINKSSPSGGGHRTGREDARTSQMNHKCGYIIQ